VLPVSEEEKLQEMHRVAREVEKKAQLIQEKADPRECQQLLKQICGMTAEYMTQ
jgi:hypothetical protein